VSATCPCGYRYECPCGCQSCPRCGPEPGPAPRVAGAISRALNDARDARTARLFSAEQTPAP
jgi:hypothetical protein